jgi:hypothetical protein
MQSAENKYANGRDYTKVRNYANGRGHTKDKIMHVNIFVSDYCTTAPFSQKLGCYSIFR